MLGGVEPDFRGSEIAGISIKSNGEPCCVD